MKKKSFILFSLIPHVLIYVIALTITGCSNLPPLIQKNGKSNILSLPSGKQIVDALIYHEDARIPLADETVIVESSANGDVRFLYPDRSYIDIDDWSNLRLLSTTVDGKRTIALFSGDHNGEVGAEMLAVVEQTRVRWVRVSSSEVKYRVNRIYKNQIELIQLESSEPRFRMFDLSRGILSRSYKQVLPAANKNDQQEEASNLVIQSPNTTNEIRNNDQEIDKNIKPNNRSKSSSQKSITSNDRNDGLIDISDSTIPVKSQTPGGYQRSAPQKIDLR